MTQTQNDIPAKHHLGWKPDQPDQRDHPYSAPHIVLQSLPKSVDLRSGCPPVYDQGQLGSCTANAIAGALEYDQIRQGQQPFTPSRLFIYFNERVIEHSIPYDSGAQIRDGVKSVEKQGACPETDWPYDINEFAVKPPQHCYDSAKLHQAISYQRIPQSLTQMKACLASGYPFVFGISVYESFESDEVAQTGIVPMPGKSEQLLGGHACLMVGYDDDKQVFLARNSWSDAWSGPMKGYFTLPYPYMTNSGLSSDFWVIRSVE